MLSFDTVDDRDQHSALCVPCVAVKFANKEVALFRNSQGLLACYCDSSSCAKGYRTLNDVLEHVKKDSPNWLGAPEVVCSAWSLPSTSSQSF